MALININLAVSSDEIDFINDIVKVVVFVIVFHISMCTIYGGAARVNYGRFGGMGEKLFNIDFINVLVSFAFAILAYNMIVRRIIKFHSVDS